MFHGSQDIVLYAPTSWSTRLRRVYFDQWITHCCTAPRSRLRRSPAPQLSSPSATLPSATRSPWLSLLPTSPATCLWPLTSDCVSPVRAYVCPQSANLCVHSRLCVPGLKICVSPVLLSLLPTSHPTCLWPLTSDCVSPVWVCVCPQSVNLCVHSRLCVPGLQICVSPWS